MKKRFNKKIMLVAAVVLLAAGAVFCFLPGDKGTPAVNTLPFDTVLDRAEAEEDLAYMYKAVCQYHPCYMDGSGKDKVFDAAYAQAKQELAGEETVTVGKLWQIGARMYCALEDGHTLITFRGSRVADNKAVFVSGDYTAVNGVERQELLARFRQVYPCEPQVDFYTDIMLDQALTMESWNRLLGLDTENGVTVETPGGSVQVHFAAADQAQGADSDGEAFYSYTVDGEKGIGVFTLLECNVTEGYKRALKDFFTEVKEKKVQKIAVDLRQNGGGNSQVINEFMRYMDVDRYFVFGGSAVRAGDRLRQYEATAQKNKQLQPVFSGEVYVLTSHYTFSSAMDFATVIQDNGIGKVIGETPGNMPTCYGDKVHGQPPHSGLLCSISYKKFYRPDRTKDALPLIPDMETDAENALEVFYTLP